MTANFMMPTRIVHGPGSIGQAGALASALGMSRVLVVTDRLIAAQPFFTDLMASLEIAGIEAELFEDCPVDARVRQADSLGAMCRTERLDGVVAIGGGSAMCCAKGAAIAATNEGSLRDYAFPKAAPVRPLPTLMVPTTAGSGVEVSQFSVLKDEERESKLIVGGGACFPTVALLDPATLASLPKGLAAASAVDALCHALEAYFSRLSTPLTDALAIGAAKTLHSRMRASILDRDPVAQADHLLASSMANMACGNARLGLGHALASPLEEELGVPHTTGVAVLLPRVLAFCAEAATEKALAVAEALGGDPGCHDPIGQIRAALFALYNDLGLPTHFTPAQLGAGQTAAMAMLAVPGLYGEAVPDLIDADSIICSPALRPMSVAQATACLLDCVEPA